MKDKKLELLVPNNPVLLMIDYQLQMAFGQFKGVGTFNMII